MLTSKVSLKIIIGLLAVAPLLADRVVSARQQRQYAREDELIKAFECYPLNACTFDFNRDGVPARFEFAKAPDNKLLIVDGEKELLRLNYDHIDNTMRTHIAIHSENDKPRLLIYDGVSYKTKLNAAYEWNGDTLVDVEPSSIDAEILAAMASRDDTGGWPERIVLRPLKRMLYLGAYYVIFIVAVVLYRKFRRSASDVENKTGDASPKPDF